MARRKAAQPKSAFVIACHEIRRIENEDQRAHVLVNVATKRDQAGHIKDHRRNRPFVRAVASEVETLRWREGKNIVKSIVKVWKCHSRARLHRQERRHKLQVFLAHLLRRGWGSFWE